MKRIYYKFLAIFMLFILIASPLIFSQPDPGNNGGGGPLGGGASIGGGIGILLTLGIGYGIKKLWESHKRNLNE